jgi:hypothetical protein
MGLLVTSLQSFFLTNTLPTTVLQLSAAVGLTFRMVSYHWQVFEFSQG